MTSTALLARTGASARRDRGIAEDRVRAPRRRPAAPTSRPVGSAPIPGPERAGDPRVTPAAGSTRCAQPVGRRGRVGVVDEQRVVRSRPVDGRAQVKRRETAMQGVYARRRACAVAVLAGIALGLTVWIVGVVGQSYADSVSAQPVGTEVTYVRAGESLSTIAERVAPDMPRQTVIDAIVELNSLSSSGVRVGQPLLTPAYR